MQNDDKNRASVKRQFLTFKVISVSELSLKSILPEIWIMKPRLIMNFLFLKVQPFITILSKQQNE